jgi:hypothetical protein
MLFRKSSLLTVAPLLVVSSLIPGCAVRNMGEASQKEVCNFNTARRFQVHSIGR